MNIWNLDDDKMQKSIFNKKRGYMFTQEIIGNKMKVGDNYL